jgi:hypothetical protein
LESNPGLCHLLLKAFLFLSNVSLNKLAIGSWNAHFGKTATEASAQYIMVFEKVWIELGKDKGAMAS